MLRVITVAVSLSLLSSVGCTCGADAAGARYKFTADGTGPEGKNLNPLRVGQVDSDFTSVIDGLAEQPRGRAFRIHHFPSGTFESWLETPTGQFVTSTTDLGVISSPLLVLPATVRVGMKWETFLDKETPAFSYEVTKREEQVATFFGSSTVWTLVQTASDGTATHLKYAEGSGRLSVPEIWPTDEQPSEVPTLRPVELTELTLPDSLAFTQNVPWIDGVSVVRPIDGAAMVLVSTAYRESPYILAVAPGGCAKLAGGALSSLETTASRPFVHTRGLVCPGALYCVKPPGNGTEGMICAQTMLHAYGVLVADDGKVTWVARKWTGEMIGSGVVSFGPEDAVVKAGGAAIAVVPLANVDGGNDALTMRTDDGRVGLPSRYGEEPSIESSAYRVIEHSFPFNARQQVPTYKEFVDFGVDSKGRRQFLMRDPDNMLFWSRLEGNRFTLPRVGGRLSGRLSVQARRGGTDILRITGEGSVDRFVLDGDELKLEHLADVPVPSGHEPIGAFADDGQLLIATIGLGVVDANGQNVSLHLYRTSTLSGSQVVRVPQILTVHARALDGFVEEANAVCWRSNGTAPDASGWLLDGQPPDLAMGVVAGDPCVVIGLDTRHDLTNLVDRPRISGTIPGIGPVLVRARPGDFNAYDESDKLSATKGMAVLKDGSFVSTRRRFSRGGLDLGLPDQVGLEWNKFTSGSIADWGGGGLWTSEATADGGRRLAVRTETTTERADLTREIPDRPLWPSGIAMESGLFVMADGGAEAVPLNEEGRCVKFADGTACGTKNVNGHKFFCVSPSGVERVVANPTGLGSCKLWIPRGDGTFLIAVNSALWGFDPVGMTFEMEERGDILGWGVDSKGRGLIARWIYGGPLHTINFASKGFPEAFKVPNGYWTYGGLTANGFQLLSSPDMTVMSLRWTGTFGDSPWSQFRLPPSPP